MGIIIIPKMKFNTIVLLIATASALRINVNDDGAAKAPPAEGENAKEAKDADWQNPYGHEKGMGEFEGKLSAKITSRTTTLKERNAEEAKKMAPEPEVPEGADITSEAKKE